MNEFISSNKEVIDLLVQILIIIIPILLTWFLRTYVKGTMRERDLAAIVNLSNTAIDYVENLDKQGHLEETVKALNLPSEVTGGVRKLYVAGDWLEKELKRNDITISDQDARNWINAEFQKRLGGVQMSSKMDDLARTAVNTIYGLLQQGTIELPQDKDQLTYLVELAADFFITQYTAETGGSISQEQALTWVRSAMISYLNGQGIATPLAPALVPGTNATVEERLAFLALQAIVKVEELVANGRLHVQPGNRGGDVRLNVATAWLLTEVVNQNIEVTVDQIGEAVLKAMQNEPAT